MDTAAVIAKTEEAEEQFRQWMAGEGASATILEQVAKRASIHHEVMSSHEDPDYTIRAERYRNGVRYTFSQKRSPEA